MASTSRVTRRLTVSFVTLVLFATPVSEAPARSPFRIGVYDQVFTSSDPVVRQLWLGRSRASGASLIRIYLDWARVAPPSKPRHASDPNYPGYSWTAIDDAVRDASKRGLEPLLTIDRAPTWAEGSNRASHAPRGTWRPEPRALAAFARAAAIRYSGSYVAESGSPLPRVRYWQIWNEPNLTEYLTPQGGTRGRPLQSAAHYRRMLRAAYAGLKSVRGSNMVVAAGTSPYGDRTGARTPPVKFWRRLLCLEGQALRRLPCPRPARFDAYAHHPYAIGSPYRRALNPDDAAIPDVHKLTRVVSAGVRSGRALPRRSKQLWITETSWDSLPPDPAGVPARTHARWLSQALYLLWRQGADVVLWHLIRDAPANGDYASTVQSGLYLYDGKPKRAQRAFRFPFASSRGASGRVRVWGKAPRAGRVLIEAKSGRGWRVIARIRTGGSNIFTRVVSAKPKIRLRARIGTRVSLSHLRA